MGLSRTVATLLRTMRSHASALNDIEGVRRIDAAVHQESEELFPIPVHAEQCLIASAMIEPQIFQRCQKIVTPEMFGQPDHAVIWQALLDLQRNGISIDSVTLSHHLKLVGQLELIGGNAYLAEILNCVPSAWHGESYARTVAEGWLRRRFIQVADALSETAFRPGLIPPGEMASQAIAELTPLARLAEIIAEKR